MAVRLSICELGDTDSEHLRSFLQDRILVGRARSCDICLPDMAVSTRHAEIRIAGNDYAVVDLGSVNGTQVNGKVLVAHRPRMLDSGDTIAIANFRVGFGIGATGGAPEPRDASLVQAKEMVAQILARSGVDPGAGSADQSLNAIFEAPEEDTSSFALDLQDETWKEEGNSPGSDRQRSIGPESETANEDASLPIGPVDPLLGGDGAAKHSDELQRPNVHGKGDVGLIIVGAVIVIAAVAGLVYLFS
ncbi:MAG: FHA domain-containing protein [Proteobacteria bacterium]|nr:FHA domain-containing protein [Pseudomonadota bacterium]